MCDTFLCVPAPIGLRGWARARGGPVGGLERASLWLACGLTHVSRALPWLLFPFLSISSPTVFLWPVVCRRWLPALGPCRFLLSVGPCTEFALVACSSRRTCTESTGSPLAFARCMDVASPPPFLWAARRLLFREAGPLASGGTRHLRPSHWVRLSHLLFLGASDSFPGYLWMLPHFALCCEGRSAAGSGSLVLGLWVPFSCRILFFLLATLPFAYYSACPLAILVLTSDAPVGCAHFHSALGSESGFPHLRDRLARFGTILLRALIPY